MMTGPPLSGRTLFVAKRLLKYRSLSNLKQSVFAGHYFHFHRFFYYKKINTHCNQCTKSISSFLIVHKHSTV